MRSSVAALSILLVAVGAQRFGGQGQGGFGGSRGGFGGGQQQVEAGGYSGAGQFGSGQFGGGQFGSGQSAGGQFGGGQFGGGQFGQGDQFGGDEQGGSFPGNAGQGGQGGFGGRRGGGRGGPGGRGGRGPPLPPFLRNLTQEQRQEFFQILTNRNATKAQIKANITSWAQAISSDLAEQVAEADANRTKFENARNANITKALNAAPSAFAQLVAIRQNDSLTIAQERSQIQALFKSLDPEVARVLSLVARPPRGPGGPFGPEGRGGRGGPSGAGRKGGRGGKGGPRQQGSTAAPDTDDNNDVDDF